MKNAKTISEALGGKKSGEGYICGCPAHADRKASFSIKDGYKRLLVYCHAGCSREEVISALIQRGLWPGRAHSNYPVISQKPRHKIKREAKERVKRDKAAWKAAAILAKAISDPAKHSYVIKKGLGLGNLVRRGEWPQRGWKDALLIPLYDQGGEITSLSAINVDGTKDLLSGGKTGGCFHPLGKFKGTTGMVLIGEGLATVAAAVDATGFSGVVAINAGNLVKVAKVVKQLAPRAEIIILADDDRKADGSNPGKLAAEKAARAVNGKVAMPDLGKKADAWDVWKEQGPNAVMRMIEVAHDCR